MEDSPQVRTAAAETDVELMSYLQFPAGNLMCIIPVLSGFARCWRDTGRGWIGIDTIRHSYPELLDEALPSRGEASRQHRQTSLCNCLCQSQRPLRHT